MLDILHPKLAPRKKSRYTHPMLRHLFSILVLLLLALASSPAADAQGKLRIICFGAHPDDCEIQAGGTAAMWAAQGHKVKFVSVTNGDIGHWKEAGGPLAQRRAKEVREAAKLLGVETEVLDIHDGELLPTLENRKLITKLIREWNADIVISHRPNDYHPDHRYTGVLVQDAAYMVTVPFFCPDIPILKDNPVFMYSPDNFKKPNPFKPDVAVSIDPVIDQRLDALDAMPSQFYEGGANGSAKLVPTEDEKKKQRKKDVRERFAKYYQNRADQFRAELEAWYGKERGAKVKHAEAFELCEYGRQPDKAELAKLFPFHQE